MFFSAKPKSFFADLSEHTLVLARTSSAVPPFVVEEIRICPAGDQPALTEALKLLQPKRTGSYLPAVCGVYPARRLVRRVALELKRVREPGYLNEVASQQLRVEPESHMLAILHASDGSEYEVALAAGKDVIICGLPIEDVKLVQAQLLASGLFPDRLELGTVATLGLLEDYLNFAKNKSPTLVLEIESESTQSFIVSATGLETTRATPQGLNGMIPVVQKELNLKDEESARKLFFSNAFDFTGIGHLLIRRLLKELQSSIGFYEVQTGQSIGQMICPRLPPDLGWLEKAVADQLGVPVLKLDLNPWLQSRQITFAESVATSNEDQRSRLGLLGLMAHYPRHAVAEKAP